MPRIYIHRFTIAVDAIDALGHVNNLRYLDWMLDIATQHSTAQGWPLERYLAEAAGWVVRSHFISYKRPAFEADAIALLTWVDSFKPRGSLRKFLFWRLADRHVLAQAETEWAYVDFKTGRPRPIPEALRSSFEVVPDAAEVLRLAEAGCLPTPPLPGEA